MRAVKVVDNYFDGTKNRQDLKSLVDFTFIANNKKEANNI